MTSKSAEHEETVTISKKEFDYMCETIAQANVFFHESLAALRKIDAGVRSTTIATNNDKSNE